MEKLITTPASMEGVKYDYIDHLKRPIMITIMVDTMDSNFDYD